MNLFKNQFARLFLFALFLSLATRNAVAIDPRAEPEAPSIAQLTKSITAKRHLIVAANPHASHAGLKILRQGGSAIDAAIATQMVLNLVEPQSSGIGGGAFMLHWDQQVHKLASFDGRETAPRAARPDRFIKNGKPMAFREAVPGGLSVGTPGVLRMLEQAHRQYGRLPWAQLFAPAIELATQGFAVSPRLHKLLEKATREHFDSEARSIFFDHTGKARPVGSRLVNKPFARALSGIAAQGADFFYRGPLAGQIAEKVQNTERNPGDMTMADLAGYRSFERPPVCITYRDHQICGMGAPSSGMLTIGQILKLLEPHDLGSAPLNPQALHLIAEASKLAYADRKRYMADRDYVHIPEGLLDGPYMNERRKLIQTEKTMGNAKPGRPASFIFKSFGKDATRENNGTSHISIVDRWGNAVSMTTSIENAFGSGLMVSGFLLNNELTDFSFRPVDKDGAPIANQVAPLKRPRSSMSPTMVFDKEGRLHMVVGSPGGSRIILYVLKTLIGQIDWKLDADALAQLPNFGSRNGPMELEDGMGVEQISNQLAPYGHQLQTKTMTSGVHLILRQKGKYQGAADPRREGIALGD